MADVEITVTDLDREIVTVDGVTSIVFTWTAAGVSYKLTFADVALEEVDRFLPQIHNMVLHPAISGDETRTELQNGG